MVLLVESFTLVNIQKHNYIEALKIWQRTKNCIKAKNDIRMKKNATVDLKVPKIGIIKQCGRRIKISSSGVSHRVTDAWQWAVAGERES